MTNNLNIFEGAKFGDKFITNGGEIAIYQNSAWDRGERYHNLITPKLGIFCYDNGDYTMKCDAYPNYNVVSRYQESIDEEELILFAANYVINLDEGGGPGCYDDISIQEAYKAGYRKAKEE